MPSGWRRAPSQLCRNRSTSAMRVPWTQAQASADATTAGHAPAASGGRSTRNGRTCPPRFNVGNAMSRNRYIYCLADAAIVISSTAEQHSRQGWDVEWSA